MAAGDHLQRERVDRERAAAVERERVDRERAAAAEREHEAWLKAERERVTRVDPPIKSDDLGNALLGGAATGVLTGAGALPGAVTGAGDFIKEKVIGPETANAPGLNDEIPTDESKKEGR